MRITAQVSVDTQDHTEPVVREVFALDDPAAKVSHLHSNHSTSRRTKPALNAFVITFGDRWPVTET